MLWICLRCGQEVLADGQPSPIRWSDGHVCCFVPNNKQDTDAAHHDRDGCITIKPGRPSCHNEV